MGTSKISHLIRADVLLLAGADDHYVPLKQLGRQAGNLTNALVGDHKDLHGCRTGEQPLSARQHRRGQPPIDTWLETTGAPAAHSSTATPRRDAAPM